MNNTGKSILLFSLISIALIAFCPKGVAQETRIVEEEKLRELEKEIPLGQQIFFDWGVWLRFEYGNIVDEVKERTWRDYEIRPWLSFNVRDIHRFYARFRLNYLDFNGGSSFDGNDSDTAGVDLDQAFYMLNVSRLMESYGSSLPYDLDLSIRVGRQFMYLGRGIAYSRVDDGFEIKLENYDFDFKLIGSRTVHSEDDFDFTRPGSSHDNRLFFGSQITYKQLRRHYPYFFFLIQQDANDEDPPDFDQEYDYDSEYYGLGVSGQIVTNLRYYGEVIFQKGESFGRQEKFHSQHIDAQAMDLGLEYYIDGPCQPKLSVEWAKAEGDPDRQTVTSSRFGNAPWTLDQGFLGFGYINTGYSFAPLFSNIEFVRLGASCRPLRETHEIFDQMELGFNFFFYKKDETAGAISDFRADQANENLGNEFDLYLNWRVLSDVAVGINYGVFYPGDAFSDRDSRSFFLTTVTYSF